MDVLLAPDIRLPPNGNLNYVILYRIGARHRHMGLGMHGVLTSLLYEMGQ